MRTHKPLMLAALLLPTIVLAEDVTFTKRPVQVGDTRTETEEGGQEITMTIPAGPDTPPDAEPKKGYQKQISSKKIKTEVLGVKDGKLTKVKVTIVEKASKVEMFNPQMMSEPRKMDRPSPLAGKSFVVEEVDGIVKVVTPEGGEVEPMTAQQVKDEASLGDPNKFAKLIPDGPVSTGKEIVVDNEAATKVFGSEDKGVKVQSMKMTLTKVAEVGGARCGVFKMSIKLQVPTPQGPLNLEMTGDVAIGVADCYPYSVNMSGPIQMGPASGVIKGESTFAYTKAGS